MRNLALLSESSPTDVVHETSIEREGPRIRGRTVVSERSCEIDDFFSGTTTSLIHDRITPELLGFPSRL